MATKMTVDDLQAQLSGLKEYQPEDDATLRARAESAYKPQYEQNLMDLRNTLTTQLAAQNRSALANGMQRSSYNQAQQASLRTGGMQAEAQLGAQYQTNLGNTLLQLMEAEKDRKTAADQNRDNLLLQLYQLMNKGGGGGKNPQQSTTPNYSTTDFYTDIGNGRQMADNLASSGLSASAIQLLMQNMNSNAQSYNNVRNQNATQTKNLAAAKSQLYAPLVTSTTKTTAAQTTPTATAPTTTPTASNLPPYMQYNKTH